MAKHKWEIEAKDRLLDFLRGRSNQVYTATNEDVVVNAATGENYDYELTPKNTDDPVIALEIFRLVWDEGDLGRHFAWNDMTRKLKAELDARGVSGYSIRTPPFNIPKFKRKQFAGETAERLADAIAANPNKQELIVDDYVLYKFPDLHSVVFSYSGGARFVNPLGSANDALDDLLPKKNDQLNVPGRLRTLLIINAGIFPHEEYYVSRYFSVTDLEQFPNIDRVFFEVTPGNISLIFDRRVFESYRKGALPDEEELLALFVPFLEHRLSSRHNKAFGIVKQIVGKFGNLDRLSLDGKDALISFGEQFVVEGEWDSLLWIIEQLKNDADPPFPNTNHDRIVEGKTIRIISSVRGRLCWLIQKVVVHNLIDQYPAMLDILEKYAFGQDFYIRSQACVPLSEMSVRRRQTLPDGSRFTPDDIAERVKGIAFRMLREARRIPALLDDLTNILRFIADVSEAEASEVTETLSSVDDLYAIHNRCNLLLYFALFRETQFADLPAFNAGRFKERLHLELSEGNSRFRQSLLWLMAGAAEADTFPHDLILPYLESFLTGPYDTTCFLHLRRICGAYAKANPKTMGKIIVRALATLADRITDKAAPNGWQLYEAQEQMKEFFDLLSDNCDEASVLGGASLIMENEATVGAVSVYKLRAVLDRYNTSGAAELKKHLGA